MRQHIEKWLSSFELDASLRPHIAEVFVAMPGEVRDDLMGDPCFMLTDFEPGFGRSFKVHVGMPTLTGPGRKGGSRAVVLKRTMWRRDTPFIRWVIAHELAHAHLRNEGRFPGDDPEDAANALAEMWGFPRPW
jgi:hypothetical protein